MNHHHRKILQSLFAHPISGNISLKDVESVLKELGAEIEIRTGSRIAVTLKGHTHLFHYVSHALPKDEVAQIRKFLTDSGISPEQYPV